MATNPPVSTTPAKISQTKAILQCRCPKCREGKMFPYSIKDFNRFAKMNQECDVCGQDFRIEPGFYFGASYFSYAFNVVFIIFFGVMYFTFFNEYSEWYLVGFILAFTIALVPVNYRYSRSLMLHLFGGVER